MIILFREINHFYNLTIFINSLNKVTYIFIIRYICLVLYDLNILFTIFKIYMIIFDWTIKII